MNEPEAIIKDELTVKVGEDEFTFKIPSIKDRLQIAAYAVKLRRDADPDGMVTSLGYDPNMVMYTETLATFIILVKGSTARWVFSPDANGQVEKNIEKWPDNVPIMEVVDQFNKELETFRKPTS